MADLATIQSRIDAIDELLATGVRSFTAGDRREELDMDALRTERTRLMRVVSGANSSSFRRVVFKRG